MNNQTMYYDDLDSSCEGYDCGRMISFLTVLISYLKNTETKKLSLNAKIYLKGLSANNAAEVDFTFRDRLCDGYLLTQSNQTKIAIKISQIAEIEFKDTLLLNQAFIDFRDESCILLKIADIIPPCHCSSVSKTKEILLKSCDSSQKKIRAASCFEKIVTYHFVLSEIMLTSLSEGFATFQLPTGGTLLTPFSSILSLTGNVIMP